MASLQYYNPPAAGARFAAYRPIVFEVVDNYSTFGTASNIPVVYLDIYINGSYYKTLSATSSRQQIFYGGFYSAYYRPVWTFDLQDAMQEYLRSEPAVLSSTTFDTAAASICTFYTKLRGSSISTTGFTVPDGPVPVQGNFDAAPVAGGGIQGVTYMAVNATLQHEDAQDLTAHLTAYKYPGVISGNINALPLTHRPTNGKYLCAVNQYDQFPLLFPYNSLLGGNTTTAQPQFIMDWQERGSSTTYFRTTGPLSIFAFSTAPFIFNVPAGFANLQALNYWAAGSATPDLNKITQYRVYLKIANDIFWQTGWIKIDRCSGNGARLHFLNSAGGYDAVNFMERQEVLTTKSAGYQKGLPRTGLQRRDFGQQRFNVQSNEKVTLRTTSYDETCQPWLMELLDSPRVYLETQSQGDAAPDLIPVVILDGDFTKQKFEDRFEYLLEVTYQLSNENIRQRG